MKHLIRAVALSLAAIFACLEAWGVPPSSTPLPAWIANVFANPYLYGAPSNTRWTSFGVVTVTSGSPNLTMTGLPFAASDVGKYIVLSGLGPSVTQSAAVAGGGTGNLVGDVLTLSMPGCTTASKLTVTAVAAGVITAAVPTTNGSCAPASLPSNPVSVASTTGAGTGATFNLTSAASSLATTVTAYTSPSQITLAANSAQTVSGGFQTVVIGNDDSAAINAALASGSTSLVLPANATYGIASPINLPTTHRIKFDCNGATIVALGPMAEMLNEPASSNFYSTSGSIVEHCDLNGMGQAINNAVDDAFQWTYTNNYFENSAPGGGNLYVGTGSGYGENSYFSGNRYRNNLSVGGAYPTYNINNNYTDNHFVDEIAYGAVNNFVDNSNGTFWTNDHGYYTLASPFVFSGNFTFASDDYADTVPAYTPGFALNGYGIKLNSWFVTGASGTTTIGVYLKTQNPVVPNIVTGGMFSNISNTNAIATSWTCCQQNNIFATNNMNAIFYSEGIGSGGDGSVCLGYHSSCGGPDTVSMGGFSNGTFRAVALGYAASTSNPGSVSKGYGPSDNGSTWDSYSPSNGVSGTSGVAQHQLAVLEQTTSGATAVRLTADTTTATKTNCAWNPNSSTMAFDVRLIVNDKTTAGKHYAAFWTAHSYTKDAGAATTLIDGSASNVAPDSTRALGTWTGASASLSADTTNGCINLSFTPPTGNTDALDVVAEIYGPQGQ